MEGGCAGIIVVITWLEHGQVDMLFDQFMDGVFQCSRLELVLKGNGDQDHLVVLVWFVFGHSFLHPALDRYYFPAFSTVSTVGVTCVWAGVDNVWEQGKLEARKMLENAAESHTSGVSMKAQSNRLRSGTFLDMLRLFSERERISGNVA